MGGIVFREGGKDSTESQVGKEVEDLGLEVKDNASQLLVVLIVGRWLFGIEVVKGNIGVKEGDGIFDGRQVSDNGSGF